MIVASVEIEDIKGIQTKIDEVVKRRIEKGIDKNKIRNAFAQFFEVELYKHPTWQSLIDTGPGTLSAIFGFRTGTGYTIAQTISDTWKNSFIVDINFKVGSASIMEITIKGVLASLSDVLQLDEAYVPSPKYTLPWLDWLVFKGTTPVIENYQVVYGQFRNSRSGYAVMKPTGSFSIPAEFAGYPGRNFLTDIAQIMGSTRDFQEKLIGREIKRALKK